MKPLARIALQLRRTGISYVVLIGLAIFSLGPLAVLASNSLRTTPQISSQPFGIPSTPRWQNYTDAWTNGNYSVTMRNTIFIVVMTILGVLVIAGMGAYSLARLRPRGADTITMYLLVGTSVPMQLFMVPLFFMWQKFGLIDTLWGVIIIYWATQSPFATFLIRSFMMAIPKDFEEAARIDGASEWQVFTQIVLPIVWPGFLTAGLVAGIGVWNEYMIALTFLHSPDVKTVTTSLSAFAGRFSQDWGLISSAAMIMVIPVAIVFLVLQRQFVEGLTRGSLKG